MVEITAATGCEQDGHSATRQNSRFQSSHIASIATSAAPRAVLPDQLRAYSRPLFSRHARRAARGGIFVVTASAASHPGPAAVNAVLGTITRSSSCGAHSSAWTRLAMPVPRAHRRPGIIYEEPYHAVSTRGAASCLLGQDHQTLSAVLQVGQRVETPASRGLAESLLIAPLRAKRYSRCGHGLQGQSQD